MEISIGSMDQSTISEADDVDVEIEAPVEEPKAEPEEFDADAWLAGLN